MRKEKGSLESGVAVGRILAPHGTAGLLKVLPLTDFPGRCRELKEVTCKLDSARRILTVERAALHGRFWLIKFSGIDARDEAAALRGALILINAGDRVALPAGSYYYDQLIGLKVYNRAGECLGEVEDIIPGAAHDLYLVRRAMPDKKSFLLPAVKAFVQEIDLAAGMITAEPPPGLMDLEL